MPFYASYRLSMRKAGKIRDEVFVWDGEKRIKTRRTTGQKIKSTLEKSKLSRPEQEVWFEFSLETGQVDEVGYIMGWGIENGYIETYGKKGGGYKIETDEGEIRAMGREKFKVKLAAEEELVAWFRETMTEGFLTASPGGTEPVSNKAGKRRGRSSSAEG